MSAVLTRTSRPERGDILGALTFQAAACSAHGSPLYARLLRGAAADVRAGGPVQRLLAPRADEPLGSALVLRFLGAVHRLVLDGTAPDLARHYPSAGGRPAPGAAAALVRTVEANADRLADELGRGVQTNEPGRSAALAPGFLTIAARTGLPLRILELGASAGLNLRFDAYRYEAGSAAAAVAFGDPAAPLRFGADVYAGGRTPPLAAALPHGDDPLVVDRRGCDPNPIDATTPAGRDLLRSFVWADQLDRLRRLDAAIDAATASAAHRPVTIDRADAGDWLAGQLVAPVSGAVTVVVHSIVQQYLSPRSFDRVLDAIERAARRATAAAPFAWLRLEPGSRSDLGDLTLNLWRGPSGGRRGAGARCGSPGDGRPRLLAHAGFHGAPVHWRAR